MSKILPLSAIIFMILLGQSAQAGSATVKAIPNIYLDLKQANSPSGIDPKAGMNVIPGRPILGQHNLPDANVSKALNSGRGLVIDPNIGGYASTGKSGVCGPRCLGNKLRVYRAEEEEGRSGKWNVAPKTGSYNSLNIIIKN